MARFIRQGTVRENNSGSVSEGATITVYLPGTTTAAVIYSAISGGSAVPGAIVTTDSDGYYKFYVDNTDYPERQLFDMKLSKLGAPDVTYPNVDIIDDGLNLATEHNADGTHDNTKVVMIAGSQTITGAKSFGADINFQGNEVVGNFTSGGNLQLRSTSHATPGSIYLGSSTYYNEGSNFLILSNGSDEIAIRPSTHNITISTGDDDSQELRMCYSGFNLGATRFRDFGIYDGKNNRLFFVDGSAGITAITGDLSVSGGIQTDGTNTLKTKVIDIGDWDMDATLQVAVAHGLVSANIVSVEAYIRSDGGSLYQALSSDNGGSSSRAGSGWDATNVILNRSTGGYFDSTGFDATSYNRGRIIIIYTV